MNINSLLRDMLTSYRVDLLLGENPYWEKLLTISDKLIAHIDSGNVIDKAWLINHARILQFAAMSELHNIKVKIDTCSVDGSDCKEDIEKRQNILRLLHFLERHDPTIDIY